MKEMGTIWLQNFFKKGILPSVSSYPFPLGWHVGKVE